MQYRIGICDDELTTCTELENIVHEYFDKSLYRIEVYVWNSGDKCCEDLSHGNKVDVLFLDIELPGMNGVDTGRHIRETMNDQATKIIYISSKTNYAMELFQIHPYDFLVKPYTKEKVSSLLEKIMNIEKIDRMQYSYTSNGNTYRVDYGDIINFMSNNKMIEIHLISGEKKTFRGKLKTEAAIFPKQFVKIGHSDIINMKYLKECHYDYVVMRDDTILNISQKYRSEFRQILCDYNNSGGVING
ncbi:MAG: LytTR family DNA-binding domain-containing protein [Lachnospira sp.]|nr:LytTR family DNA-binding domain-containing protein [Lachnospira sp.]